MARSEPEVAAPAPRRFPHNPALDGLRAIAVLVVVLYHTGLLTGGWIGVEIFFVLSGYLITSLLLVEMDTSGRVDLVAFWRRRARRLLPALFVFLLVVAAFVGLVADATADAMIRRDVLAALTYSSNWSSIFGGGGYWQDFAAPSPLHHMWSLAVEEQFYVIFPILALVVLRAPFRRWALPLLATVALVWQLWMTHHAPLDRFYLGTDTRAFGILLGACIALITSTAARRIARWCVPAALAVLTFAAWHFDGESVGTFHGGFQLVTVCTALVVLGMSAGDRGPVGSALSIGVLVAVGRWSYGIYLIHWPLAEALRQRFHLSPWPVTLIVVPVSIALAAASFHLIESPIRRRGLRSFGRPLVPVAVAAVIVVAAVGSTIIGSRHPPAYFSGNGQVVRVASATTELPPTSRAGVGAAPSALPTAVSTTPSVPPRPTPVATASAPSTAATTTTSLAAPVPVPERIVVFGDSVPGSMTPHFLDGAAARGMDLSSAYIAGCGLLPGSAFTPEWDLYEPSLTCRAQQEQAIAAAVEQVHPTIAVWWSAWDASNREIDGERIDPSTPDGQLRFTDLVDAEVATLQDLGMMVVLVTNAPWGPSSRGPAPGYEPMRQLFGFNEVLRAYAAAHPDVSLIDVAAQICPDDAPCDGRDPNGVLYRPTDGIHYDGPAADELAAWMLDHLEPLRTSPP